MTREWERGGVSPERMNGVGDIERMEVSLRRLPCNLPIGILRSRRVALRRVAARARAKYIAKGTRTKIDSIIVVEADEPRDSALYK